MGSMPMVYDFNHLVVEKMNFYRRSSQDNPLLSREVIITQRDLHREEISLGFVWHPDIVVFNG